MSKVICDICGTTYPDTADQCPICGCSRDLGAQLAEDGLLMEELRSNDKTPRAKGGHFSSSNVRKRTQNPEAYPEEEEAPVKAYKGRSSQKSNGNSVLVALLIVVILALLAVTGYIFVKYFVPNMTSGDPKETTEATKQTQETESTGETEPPTVPCESLTLVSEETIEFTEVGQYHLVNVQYMPADTTDTLNYSSSDESVATVNYEGRVEAVGEGEAFITVSCGEQVITCTVVVAFPTEETTEAPTEVVTEETTEPPTEPPTVTITASKLYIRKTPGSTGEIVGNYFKGDEVQILETQDVNGTTWGRTDKGWISMDYTE